MKSSTQKKMKENRTCKLCGLAKPLNSFYTNGQYKGKVYHLHQCKPCSIKRTNEPRIRKEIVKRYKEKNPDKVTARESMHSAIRNGTLVRQPCFCGETKVHGHHHKGYSKNNQLNVIWLCQSHHMKLHKELWKKEKSQK